MKTRYALEQIRDNAEASYWELRHWLDTHPKLEWIRGDDGPCYPFLQLARQADNAIKILMHQEAEEMNAK